MSYREKIIIIQLKKLINIKKHIEFSNNKEELSEIKKKCDSIIYQLIDKTKKEIKELKKIENYLKDTVKKIDKNYLKDEMNKEIKEIKEKIKESKKKFEEYKSYL